MTAANRWRLMVGAAALASTTACAAKAPMRPTGAATADPTAVTTLEASTAHCRPLRTATAEIRLSGRAGTQRIRARLLAGFAAPGAVRLEALAPFGPPALILAGEGAATTLWFPRDQQVLRDAPIAAVLEALTGLSLDADELRRMIFGCLGSGTGRGERYGDAWQAVVDGETTVFLHHGVPVAAGYKGWQIDYGAPTSGVARQVRVRRTVPAGAIDLVADLGDVSLNVDLQASAFGVAVPAGATAITLEDLRRSSPLTAR